MADPFWDPIFDKLKDDIELIRLMAEDLPDAVLLKTLQPNQIMQKSCAPFVKNGRIGLKRPFLTALLRAAKNDTALRKIIFFEWIVANPQPIKFPTIPANDESLKMLENGIFGSPHKVKILSKIDPREAAIPVFERFFENRRVELQSVQNTQDKSAELTHPVAGSKEPASDPLRKTSELEARLCEARQESREFRQKSQEFERHNKELQNRLAQNGTLISDLQIRLKQATDEIERLKIALERSSEKLEAQPERQPVVVETPTCNNSEEELQKRIFDAGNELEERLRKKTTALKGLEARIEDMRKQISVYEDQTRQIENLRRLLQNAESDLIMYEKPIIGRLTGEQCRLIQTIHNEFEILPEMFVVPEEFDEGEWVMLLSDENNLPRKIISLENGKKSEVVGILRKINDLWYLEGESECHELLFQPEERICGNVVTGRILSEALDRRKGIVSVRPHKVKEQRQPRRDVSINDIRRFYDLATFSSDTFSKILTEAEIPFTHTGDKFIFETDHRSILHSLRQKLPVTRICNSESCRMAALKFPFVGRIRNDEICGICLEERDTVDITRQNAMYDFGGVTVLVVGGDFVGTRYKDVLERHNLDIRWLSGYAGLGGARSGLGGVSAVVVILKQISHTVLRELLAIAARDSIPILYSRKRGISGVLSCLQEYFKSEEQS